MADDLYTRYMRAHQELRMHTGACADCTDTARCPVGERLYESFARLQDAHLGRQQRRHSP